MTIPEVVQKPVEIFISYSRKDLAFLQELRSSLRVFEIEQGVRIWHDGNLTPGVEWEEELYARFYAAHIILLLIGPNFFSSDYCSSRELPEALKRHEQKTARVIPVIIQPVPWKRSKLAKLMVLPKDGRPVELWEHRSEAYENIGESLFELFDLISKEIPRPAPDRPRPGQKISFVWTPGVLGPNPSNTGGDEVLLPGNALPPPLETQPASAAESLPAVERDPEAITAAADLLPAPVPINKTPTHTDVPRLPRSEPAKDRAAPVANEPKGASKFIVPEVVVCFLHKDRRDKLQSLRRWCLDPKDPLFAGPAAHVIECQTLEEALARVRQRSEETVLLLDGFEPESPPLEELLRPVDQLWKFEVIINAPEWEPFAAQRPSASILQPMRTVAGDETLLETLRKSLLRVRTRQLAAACVLKSKAEFAEFFALRYRVWTDLGYLSAAKTCPQTPWEVDYTDRTSLPMGIFSKVDGRLLAAARLVRGFGDENNASMIRLIEEMLREQGSELLQRNFRYPVSQQHPFDILGEMTQFKEYYRSLVRNGIAKAEVSRVIVSPDWQRGGLGEVVVDTLCSLARAHSIRVLFLACHAKHAEFYRRCGFQTIPGVTGTQFLTYKVPCIAMEKQLFSSGELPE